ncbi:MAG: hypothetical protein HW391_990 [Chloroflexi bacterium]|nr:hypothetical protein [Chloroflexota bacterium]
MCGLLVVAIGPWALVGEAVLFALVLRGPMKLATGSGTFAGFGAGILVLLGPLAVTCTIDPACGEITLFSWVRIGVGFIILAVGLGLAARAQPDADATRGRATAQPPG